MGRTLPTFNTYLQEEIDAWRPFRRALRAEHKAAFDRLFTRARRYTAEATNTARPVPFEAILMAILLDQELEMEQLHSELESLRERMERGEP